MRSTLRLLGSCLVFAAAWPLAACDTPTEVSPPVRDEGDDEKRAASPTGCGAPNALVRRFEGCELPEHLARLEPGEPAWMPAGIVLRGEGASSCQIVLFSMTDCGPAITTFGTRSPFGDRWTMSTDGRYRACSVGEDGKNVCWFLPLAVDVPATSTLRLCALLPDSPCACDDVSFTVGPDGSITLEAIESCAG